MRFRREPVGVPCARDFGVGGRDALRFCPRGNDRRPTRKVPERRPSDLISTFNLSSAWTRRGGSRSEEHPVRPRTSKAPKSPPAPEPARNEVPKTETERTPNPTTKTKQAQEEHGNIRLKHHEHNETKIKHQEHIRQRTLQHHNVNNQTLLKKHNTFNREHNVHMIW